jgi:hypothetical protein
MRGGNEVKRIIVLALLVLSACAPLTKQAPKADVTKVESTIIKQMAK